MVPEAVYSQLNLVGCGPPSRRRMSACWSCLAVTAAFVSVLLNLAMSIAALIVIIRVTSPDSDVIGTLLWTLRCHDRSNCVSSADNVTHRNALQSLHGQLVRVGLSACAFAVLLLFIYLWNRTQGTRKKNTNNKYRHKNRNTDTKKIRNKSKWQNHSGDQPVHRTVIKHVKYRPY